VRLNESVTNGATFINVDVTDSFDLCLKWCCQTELCNLGVWDQVVSAERKREREREREKEREIEKEREFVGPGGECLWCLWVLVSPSWGMEFIMRGGHNIICPFTHNVEKIKHQTKIMFSLLLIIELMTDSFI
jgi:hypothetical protein